MMTNDDVKAISSKLLTIHKLAVGNTGAYVCYSSHAKFIYKGRKNDDVAVFSSIMKKKNGVWKVVHGQRSTGRKPSEPYHSLKYLDNNNKDFFRLIINGRIK